MSNFLDLLGIFTFGMSGASLAVRHRFDVVGAISLALVTGLAGGILRDLFLGDTPPSAFRNQWYLLVPVIAALVVIANPSIMTRLARPVILFDAMGLSLFSVVGAAKASEAGLGVGAATIIGVVSATGGGIIRDMFVLKVPEVFTPMSGLYVIPASVGAAIVAATIEFSGRGVMPDGINTGLVSTVAAVGIMAVRMLSVYLEWSTPRLGEPQG